MSHYADNEPASSSGGSRSDDRLEVRLHEVLGHGVESLCHCLCLSINAVAESPFESLPVKSNFTERVVEGRLRRKQAQRIFGRLRRDR